MADTSGTYTIQQLVQRAIAADGGDESKYNRFLQLATEGINELKIGTVGGETWLKVTPNSLNRINLPSDMYEFVAIGIPVNGKLYTLTEDSRIIATYTDDGDGSYSLDATDGEGVALQNKQWESMRATGGVNLYGYYKIDWEARQVIVNATSRSELLLIYMKSGVDAQNPTYIERLYVPALVAYILWMDKETDVNVPNSIVQRFHERYEALERSLSKRRITYHKFRDTLAKSYSLLRR